MSVVEVTCHSEQELPPGWSWGAFWCREGASGYYAIDSLGRAVAIRLVPDRAFLRDTQELAVRLDAALEIQARLRIVGLEAQAKLRALMGAPEL